jgi:hypothetical protein
MLVVARTLSKFPGRCPYCWTSWGVGEMIVKVADGVRHGKSRTNGPGSWVCLGCSGDDGSVQLGFDAIG